MLVRFFVDPDTDLPHFFSHGISSDEVLDILRGPAEHWPAREGSQMAEGQTRGGRYLRVIYREDDVDGAIFVITAYDLTTKAKTAYRRRRRKRL